MDKETLADYVKRLMEEKGLKAIDVERASKGAITDSYLSDITGGRRKNPTVSKLQALAAGLNADEDELFDVARGRSAHKPDQLWSPEGLLNVMAKVNASPELTMALRKLLKLKPNQIKALLPTLEPKGK